MAGGHLFQALMRWRRGRGQAPVGPRTFATDKAGRRRGSAPAGLHPTDARGQYVSPKPTSKRNRSA